MAAFFFNTLYPVLGGNFFGDWIDGLNLGALIFIAVGIILLVVEMIIPGFGIAGFSGAACCIVGLVMGSKSILSALFSLAIILVILLIAAILIFKVLFRKDRKRKTALILNETIDSASNEVGSDELKALLGKEGLTLTYLRPTGFAMIDGKRLDVLADGEFIKKGVKVRVCDVRGLRVSVVRAEGAEEETAKETR